MQLQYVKHSENKNPTHSQLIICEIHSKQCTGGCGSVCCNFFLNSKINIINANWKRNCHLTWDKKNKSNDIAFISTNVNIVFSEKKEKYRVKQLKINSNGIIFKAVYTDWTVLWFMPSLKGHTCIEVLAIFC